MHKTEKNLINKAYIKYNYNDFKYKFSAHITLIELCPNSNKNQNNVFMYFL